MRRNLIVILIFLSISSWGQDFELIKYQDIGVTGGKMKTSDLNIDGILDLVLSGTADNGNAITSIFTYDTINGLIQEQQLSGYENPQIALSDLNNDGYNDILISGLIDGLPSFMVYQNESNFQFIPFGDWPNFKGNVKTADLDNNGKVDILASGFGRNNDILNNIWIQNTSGFTLRDSSGFENIDDFEILDYNGDNFSDILLTTGEQGGIIIFQILENDGWANFEIVDPNIAGYIDPRISKGDFSRNGEMDLLIGGQRDSGYFVDLYTNVSGTFALTQTVPVDTVILDLISVDITNDGIMDGIVLTANAVILLKSRIDSFEEVILLDSLSGGSIAIGDFDKDYDQDLFISGKKNDSLSIWTLKNLHVKNLRPSRPSVKEAKLTTEGFIIEWQQSLDDTTPVQSLSYRVILKEEGNLANVMNWTVSQYGPMELGTDYIFHELQPGFYEIWIIAQDNSLITEFALPIINPVTGMCNPIPGLCVKYGISPEIEICQGESLEEISVPTGNEVTWYSQEQDSIGVYDSIPFKTDKDDVLYATYTDPQGCQIYWFQKISVIEPSFELSLIDSVRICKGDELLESELGLSIDSEEPLPFDWSLLGSDSTIVSLIFPYVVQNDGIIFLTIEDTTQCEFFYRIQIKSSDRPFINAGDDVTLVLGETVQLSATPGLDRYEWSPSDGLSYTTQSNPLCSPTQETLYTVKGYNDGNCSNQDQILVSVIREVFVPNLFSPNNDGNNDFFKVYGDGLKELTLQIFTNSGSLIYESTDISEIQTVGWDGSSKGNPIPAGVYFWSLTGKYNNGQAVNVDGRNSGLVTLVR